MKVIKKDGTLQDYDENKIIRAINKSADRALYVFNEKDYKKICQEVLREIEFEKFPDNEIPVAFMHNAVERVLLSYYPSVGRSYQQYRNYKLDFIKMLDDVYKKSQTIRYIGDVSNANTDSTMVSTQRSLIYGQLNKNLYHKFFLNKKERQAVNDGYIYIHDMKDRLDGINCCLFDIANVLKDGFEMGNVWYNEPKTLDVAFDVISDVTISAASQQYGGFTLPRIDTVLAPYAEKSYKKYQEEYINIADRLYEEAEKEKMYEESKEHALKKVHRDFEQGFQSWEYRFNTVGSSRGDYPFVAVSFGVGMSVFERMATEVILKVRMNGQGKEGFKKPVLFPKLTFLYDKNLHGENKEMEYLFDIALKCSSKTMYPDFLSLTGEGYIPSVYKKYGKVVSLMGCVDGREIITYRYKGILYVESFKRMWDRLSDCYVQEEQIKGIIDSSDYLYLKTDDGNVEIYDTKKGFVKVQKVIRNKNYDWIKVKIANGRQLLCSLDHPFPTVNRGRVRADELVSSDIVTISTKQFAENEIDFDTDKAWLLGMILCDGNYADSVKVSIAYENENDIEQAYISRMKKCFDADVKIIKRERGTKGYYKDLILQGSNVDLINYFHNKFDGVNKISRHIPNEVFRWKNSARLSFLAGMIDADGFINPQSHGGSVVQIGSINKELSLQQAALAQSLRMEARIYENHYDKKNASKIRYRVEFYPASELIRYIVSGKKKNNYIERILTDTKSEVRESTVVQVERIYDKGFSYDVETESDYFEVSGIYSHNCRASLSPWFERGGMTPKDENDVPVFEGRFNLGAVSLHLPMILAQARQEDKDFYKVLNYYLEMIRGLHKRTFAFMGEKLASTNPLGFMQGGFYCGNLKANDKILPLLKAMTMSFGITALNELQVLYNGKSIVEDGQFALEVMQYINEYVNRIKKEDSVLYAIYGTPAESLAGLQIEQFRKKYGIIKGVSDRAYVSNSFHCGVWEDISPIQKQDYENRFWNLFNGGKIQYCRYPISYNHEAQKSLVRRAMELGFYEGCNLALSYCEDCGYEQLDMDLCPKCGSDNITKIDRMNGLTA